MNLFLFMFLCFVFYKSQLGDTKFLHSSTTPEAGNVDVFYEYLTELNQVEITINFQDLRSPFWLAVGFNTQQKMFGTRVLMLKYDGSSTEWYNGLNENYVAPTQEKGPSSELILVSEASNNGNVTVVLRRDISFKSTADPNILNDLTSCYRVAIVTGRLSKTTPLPHTTIPIFTPECTVLAQRVINNETTAVINTTTRPSSTDDFVNIPFKLNISVDLPYTDNYKNNKSAAFFQFNFKFKKFVTESLLVDNILVTDLNIESLSPGSVIVISSLGVYAQETPDIEKRIKELLQIGDKTLLPVINNRVFVIKEIPNVPTTIAPFDTTQLPVQNLYVELTVEQNFTDGLKNSSSNEYKNFVAKLESFTKSGFENTGLLDSLKSWRVESLRSGSVIAMTSLGVASSPGSNIEDLVLNAIKSGDSSILPVNLDKISVKTNIETTTVQPNTTTTTKPKDDSSSVSAVAIAVPIVCGVFLIILVIVAFCIFRRRRRARNSYILQTAAERSRTAEAARAAEIPRNSPRRDSTDDRKSQSNISTIQINKNLNTPPPTIRNLTRNDETNQKRDSEPPTYSMTDAFSSVDDLRKIPRQNESDDEEKDKIELKDLSIPKRGLNNAPSNNIPKVYYDTSDMEDTNLASMIKRSNNPLFQSNDSN